MNPLPPLPPLHAPHPPRPFLRRLASVLAGTACAALCVFAPATPAAVRERIVLPTDVTPDEYRVEVTPDPDPAAAAFRGRAEIDVHVHRATARVVLNAADLAIERATLVDGGRDADVATVSYDTARETATLAFPHPLAAGAHTLRLAWHGRVNTQAAGLFGIAYATADGPRRALFTQFENADARRFLPCWDEPAAKAVFRLDAIVPDGLMAVSNTTVATTEPRPGGLRLVRFAPTPRMSSYLLFFALGDFERVHRDVAGVDVGVVVKRGDTAQADVALEAAAQLLPYYDAYFGTPYPLRKLDLVAAPGGSTVFGAMENWGAILLFERYVLADPRVSTAEDRYGIFSIVAHEMAHQWFGDLVTMAWWDDLWLNEGFATWLGHKASERFHPEWTPWLRLADSRRQTLDLDARAGTHPVITPIDDVLQAADAFDAITYTKGALVIRTLESEVGERAFQAGIARYMRAHAYGNTVTDDLWRALEAGGDRSVTRIAHALTLQAGVPQVDARVGPCRGGSTTVTLAQGRYALDAGSAGARTWPVPIAVATVGGRPVRTVVTGPVPRRIVVPGCGPVVVNAGQGSYVRSRYEAAQVAALSDRFAALAAEDQAGVLDDVEGVALAGGLPMAAALEFAARLPADVDPLVATLLVERLADLDRLLADLPARPAFRAWGRAVLGPMLARIGRDAVPGEPANVGVLRDRLAIVLGDFGDAPTLADARARFARWLADPATLDAETRRTTLRLVAGHADAPTWDALHALARRAGSELERNEFYRLLATPEDPALAARALELAQSDEPPASLAGSLIARVAERHPRLAFDFAVARWDRLSAALPPARQASFVPDLVYDATEARLADDLEAFARAHIAAPDRLAVDRAQADIRWKTALRTDRVPEIAAWLAGRSAAWHCPVSRTSRALPGHFGCEDRRSASAMSH